MFVFLFIEALTGLILAEPWLVGQESKQLHSRGFQQNLEQGEAPGLRGSAKQSASESQSGFNAYVFAKELHRGKVGNVELNWLLDFLSISLMILTLTGVYISIPILRRRKKKV